MRLNRTPKLIIFSCLFLLLTSCQKEITDQILDSGRVNNSATFIKCKINGADKTFNITPAAVKSNSGGFFSLSITGKANNDPANSEGISMSIDGISDIIAGTYSEDLAVGSFGFSSGANYDHNDPLNISSSDFTGPPEVPFSITISSIDSLKVTGTFQGNLYDSSGTGSTITSITAGEFDLPF